MREGCPEAIPSHSNVIPGRSLACEEDVQGLPCITAPGAMVGSPQTPHCRQQDALAPVPAWRFPTGASTFVLPQPSCTGGTPWREEGAPRREEGGPAASQTPWSRWDAAAMPQAQVQWASRAGAGPTTATPCRAQRASFLPPFPALGPGRVRVTPSSPPSLPLPAALGMLLALCRAPTARTGWHGLPGAVQRSREHGVGGTAF